MRVRGVAHVEVGEGRPDGPAPGGERERGQARLGAGRDERHGDAHGHVRPSGHGTSLRRSATLPSPVSLGLRTLG